MRDTLCYHLLNFHCDLLPSENNWIRLEASFTSEAWSDAWYWFDRTKKDRRKKCRKTNVEQENTSKPAVVTHLCRRCAMCEYPRREEWYPYPYLYPEAHPHFRPHPYLLKNGLLNEVVRSLTEVISLNKNRLRTLDWFPYSYGVYFFGEA